MIYKKLYSLTLLRKNFDSSPIVDKEMLIVAIRFIIFLAGIDINIFSCDPMLILINDAVPIVKSVINDDVVVDIEFGK